MIKNPWNCPIKKETGCEICLKSKWCPFWKLIMLRDMAILRREELKRAVKYG